MLLFGHTVINVKSPFSNNFFPAFSLFASKKTIKEDIKFNSNNNNNKIYGFALASKKKKKCIVV